MWYSYYNTLLKNFQDKIPIISANFVPFIRVFGTVWNRLLLNTKCISNPVGGGSKPPREMFINLCGYPQNFMSFVRTLGASARRPYGVGGYSYQMHNAGTRHSNSILNS